MSDNVTLSRKRRSGVHRDDAEIVAGIRRQIVALGRRLAEDDPARAELLVALEDEVRAAWVVAVRSWRAAGFSDTDIGVVLGVTKQAVQQRWPR